MASFKSIQYGWAAAGGYELVHKFYALKDNKARVHKPNWYDYPYDKPKPTEFERSRPLVTSERLLTTICSLVWAPFMAPYHLAGDIVHTELWMRGVEKNETTYLYSWEQATFL